jgi:hypothetical protein
VGNTAQMMYQHINVAPADIDLDRHPIPTGLSPVLLKALAKESGQRYARVTDFATAMAIAMRMEPTTASVLLPVVVGAPTPGAARPPTAPTEMDTPEEKVDTVAEDYRTGLEALALGKWAAAVSAFDRVLDAAPEYGSAAEFSRQAKVNLEQATAVDKTVVEPRVAPVAAPPVDVTMVEPPARTAPVQPITHAPDGQAAAPPAYVPTSATAVPPQEPTRKVPLWAMGLALLLLLIIAGYGLTQVLGRGGEREPSAADNASPVAAAAIVETATPEAENTATSLPEPSATPLPVVAATSAPVDTPPGEETATPTEEKSPVPIIQNPETTPAETVAAAETPTEEPTAVPIAQAAIVRVIVSSANLRRGPGTVYPVAGAILADQEVTVLATNTDGSWYNVELADGSRAWLAASVTEPVDAAALASVPVAATIPVAPTSTPIPPTPTRPRPTAPPPPPTATIDSGGGGGNGGGNGGGGGGSEPPPKYTAEPP